MVKPTDFLGEKILNYSNSYKFYKEQFEMMEIRLEELEAISESEAALFNTIFTDYTLVPNQLTMRLHNLSEELMIFVDNVCMKYGLEYWIDYGTLLGAVRHSGFIPFDDDLDFTMTREDYLKFAKHMMYEIEKYDLSDNLKLRYKARKYLDIDVGGKFLDKNATPGGGFLQIFYFNYDPTRIALQGLDVFPYDFIKSYDENLNSTANKARDQFYRESMVGDYNDALDNYYKALDLSFEEEKHLIQGTDGPFGGSRGRYPLFIFNSEDIFPLKKIRFENIEVSAPNNPDSYLKTIYKDYLKLPKLVDTHGRMDRLKKYPNINEAYDNAILKLKNVNEIFE